LHGAAAQHIDARRIVEADRRTRGHRHIDLGGLEVAVLVARRETELRRRGLPRDVEQVVRVGEGGTGSDVLRDRLGSLPAVGGRRDGRDFPAVAHTSKR